MYIKLATGIFAAFRIASSCEIPVQGNVGGGGARSSRHVNPRVVVEQQPKAIELKPPFEARQWALEVTAPRNPN